MFDAVAELLGHVAGVLGERVHGVLRLPAAVAVLQRLRQVPVIQRRERLDPGRQQLVDETVVEVEALLVRRARALGEDPRPGDPEAVAPAPIDFISATSSL